MAENLSKSADATVSVLAFTPGLKVIPVHLHAREEQSIQIGDGSGNATQFVFTPQRGLIHEWLGKVTGKLPAEFHYDCWMMVEGIPSFVHYGRTLAPSGADPAHRPDESPLARELQTKRLFL